MNETTSTRMEFYNDISTPFMCTLQKKRDGDSTPSSQKFRKRN
eukprot:gene9430-18521_t